MKWTDQHDLELIKEILTERPFDQVWENIVDSLNYKGCTRSL
jgi:hypothetical protein